MKPFILSLFFLILVLCVYSPSVAEGLTRTLPKDTSVFEVLLPSHPKSVQLRVIHDHTITDGKARLSSNSQQFKLKITKDKKGQSAQVSFPEKKESNIRTTGFRTTTGERKTSGEQPGMVTMSTIYCPTLLTLGNFFLFF